MVLASALMRGIYPLDVNSIHGSTNKWLVEVCNYLKNTKRCSTFLTNFRTKGLRSKRGISPCIFQVQLHLYQPTFYYRIYKFSFRFRYDIHLTNSCKFGIDKGLAVGFGLGIFQVSSLGNYALALWQDIFKSPPEYFGPIFPSQFKNAPSPFTFIHYKF